MSKSSEVLTIQEVAQFYGVSEQTIQRRMRDSREGRSTFPRPIFSNGKRALFHKFEIEGWKETAEPEEPAQGR